MMKLLLIIMVLFFQQETVEPELAMETSSPPVVEVGEEIYLKISTLVGTEKSQYSVTLLPLDMESFSVKSITSDTFTAGSVFDSPRKISFHIVLEAMESGNGVLNELQVELTPPGEDGKPILLIHPGFTAQIVEPFRIEVYLPWILGGLVLAIAGIYLYFRFYTSSDQEQQKLSPNEEKRLHTLQKLEKLKIRGEWEKIIEVAYNTILEENISSKSPGDRSRISFKNEDMAQLTATWEEFPAIYRLGEEVRYGGYQPQKQEAVFMIKFTKDYFSKLTSEEKRTEEAE